MKRVCILPAKMGMGGPASFQRKLVAGLKLRDIEVTYDLDDMPFDSILIINGTRHLYKLWQCKKKGIRIVQRLGLPNDLCHHLTLGLRGYLQAVRANLIMPIIRKYLADHIVYQSHFTAERWIKLYGSAKVPTEIIYNGVDTEQFCPEGPKYKSKAKICIISVEGTQGNDPFDIVVNLGQRLVEKNMDIEILMFGTSWNNAHTRFSQHSFINFMGSVPNCELPYFYRGADIFISADILTAACPNSVLEAMACGTPVIGYEAGALSEILNDSSGQCVTCRGNPYKGESPGNQKGLDAAAMTLLNDQVSFSEGARQLVKDSFGLNDMVDKYIEVLLGSR